MAGLNSRSGRLLAGEGRMDWSEAERKETAGARAGGCGSLREELERRGRPWKGLAAGERERGLPGWGKKSNNREGAAAAQKWVWRLQPHKKSREKFRLGIFVLGFFNECPLFLVAMHSIYRGISLVKFTISPHLAGLFNLILNFQFTRFDPALTFKFSIYSIFPL